MPQTAFTPLPEDEFATAFPGCALTHVFTLASEDQLGVAIATLEAIKAFGGRLDGFHVRRCAGALAHQVKVVGLEAQTARRLCERLAAVPGVSRASLEHQIFPSGA